MAKQTLRYGSIPIKQHDYVLYLFSAPAKVLFDILAINERDPDKDEGYQRALSTSRVRSISDFVDRRRTIAPAIVVSLKKGAKFDKDSGELIPINPTRGYRSLKKGAKFDKDSGELLIPNQPNSGWVIDGQHRLVGAAKASKDITLAVVAFIDMDIDDQVFQFVTINRTAKGVLRLHCITIFSSTFLRARTLERLRKIRRQTSPTNSDTTKIRRCSIE